jgi:hypothetical protein
MITLLSLVLFHPCFETYFTADTMRLDTFHSGTSEKEEIAIDRILKDGPWSGNPSHCIDDLNRGVYQFNVQTPAGELIFSQGYSSIFAEWQSTPAAKTSLATFHESIRFPWPKDRVHLILRKRQADQSFKTIWEYDLDPSNRQIHKCNVPSDLDVTKLIQNGESAHKVDLVLLSDGFTRSEHDKFLSDANRLVRAFFKEEPFRSRKADFNVWCVFAPSLESGISKPHHGIYKNSFLETQYSSFDSERYILTTANKKVRDMASAVPYDFTIILVNESTYGGGGIYKLYSTCPVDSEFSSFLFIHEFGHHFAGLADEYFTSDVAYATGSGKNHPEPWEPNITAHPRPNLKWKKLVSPGTPIPTPWNKPAYEKLGKTMQRERETLRNQHAAESKLNELFHFQTKRETAIFTESDYNGKVGAFEGAGYFSHGMFRPSMDCIMFSRNPVGFCPVCVNAISKMIDFYSAHPEHERWVSERP